MEYPQLITVPQAARLLGVSRSTTYKILNEGKMGSVYIGRSRRISRDQFFDFVRGLSNA